MVASWGKQVLLLTKKSVIMRVRHPCLTACEFCCPIVLIFLLTILPGLIASDAVEMTLEPAVNWASPLEPVRCREREAGLDAPLLYCPQGSSCDEEDADQWELVDEQYQVCGESGFHQSHKTDRSLADPSMGLTNFEDILFGGPECADADMSSCYCKTLALVGPGAAEFAEFARAEQERRKHTEFERLGGHAGGCGGETCSPSTKNEALGGTIPTAARDALLGLGDCGALDPTHVGTTYQSLVDSGLCGYGADSYAPLQSFEFSIAAGECLQGALGAPGASQGLQQLAQDMAQMLAVDAKTCGCAFDFASFGRRLKGAEAAGAAEEKEGVWAWVREVLDYLHTQEGRLGERLNSMRSSERRLQEADKEDLREWQTCAATDDGSEPNTSDVLFRVFSSEQDMLDLIARSDYGFTAKERSNESGTDRFCGSVIFQSDPLGSSPQATIRMNLTYAGDGMGFWLAKNEYFTSNDIIREPVEWYGTSSFQGVQILLHRYIRLNKQKSTPTTATLPSPADLLSLAAVSPSLVIPTNSFPATSPLAVHNGVRIVSVAGQATQDARQLALLTRVTKGERRDGAAVLTAPGHGVAAGARVAVAGVAPGEWKSKGATVLSGEFPVTAVSGDELEIDLSSCGCNETEVLSNIAATIVYLSSAEAESVQIEVVEENYPFEKPWVMPFPIPEYRQNSYLEALAETLPLALFIGFMGTVGLTTGHLIRERELRLKESMRMMGLSDSAFYASWYLVYIVQWFLMSLLITACKFVFLLKFSNFILIWMFYWVFGMAITTMSFFVSTVFRSELMGSLLSCVFFFMTMFITEALPEYPQAGSVLATSLFPTAAFIHSVQVLFELEIDNLGVTGGSLGVVSERAGPVAFGDLFGFLILDIFLWSLLFYYSDQVFPNPVGVQRVPWFFVTKDYWLEVCGKSVPPPATTSSRTAPEGEEAGNAVVEELPAPVQALARQDRCAKVSRLNKVFTDAEGNEIKAVNDLSVTMVEGECFCLLGHNGAGKTTTMSMITGTFPPTSGEITIFGKAVPQQLKEVRASMGMCPQHNVLWPELTVLEHMRLTAGLKGIKGADAEIDQLLNEVQLAEKRNARAAALSGGMKRKLSVAMAFLGDPKFVILDEPTSGMDPYARRAMWDLLRSRRQGRVLCLTTHYMDEAEVLGDRICIMASGKVQCNGSSVFLKKQYGCGYIMTFQKKKADTPEKPIQDLVTQEIEAVPGMTCVRLSGVGTELRLQVPFDAAPVFPRLLGMLDEDEQRERLGIENYGLSVTQLEEVFLKVASGHAAGKGKTAPNAEQQQPSKAAAEENQNAKTGCALQLQQFGALVQRRIRYGARDKKMFCCQLLCPSITLLVLVAMITASLDLDMGCKDLVTTTHNDDFEGRVYVPVGARDGLLGEEFVTDMWSNYKDNSDQVDTLTTFTDIAPTARNFSHTLLDIRRAHEPEAHYGAYSYFATFPGAQPPPDHVVWVNTSYLHACGTYVNMHFNAWMKKVMGNDSPQLRLTNCPLPRTPWEESRVEAVSGIITSLFTIVAFSFVPAGIVSFVCMENQKDVKYQLVVSGCSRLAYWLSNLLFDFVFSLVLFGVSVAVFYGYDVKTLLDDNHHQATIPLLFLYGPAAAAFAYTWSFFFTSPSAAQTSILVFQITAGFIGTILVMILTLWDPDSCGSCQSIGEGIMWVSRLTPAFCLGNGLRLLSISPFQSDELDPLSGQVFGNCKKVEWGSGEICWTKAGDDVFFLALNIVFHVVLAITIDIVGDIPSLRRLLVSRAPPTDLDQEDEDVVAEKTRVAALTQDQLTQQKICVNNVRKVYGGKIHAVKGISFAASEGQVFGLLGVNGAGKTTTFKMLCAQYTPSAGDLRVAGLDVTREVAKVRQQIGYCPQFDALLELMTVKEHLELFAMIKGLHGETLKKAVERRLKEMDLVEYTNSRAGQLSGGNKRKLSVAMATMGEPPIIFLDEPSAGMDPYARRYMWDVIQSIASRSDSSVVIITTHSMEEAEALCSRVAIQVDGQFRCLGSCQQIKTRYGGGLEINVKFSAPTKEAREALINGWLPDANQTLEAKEKIHFSRADALNLCKTDPAHGEARAASAQASNGILAPGVQNVIASGDLADWWAIETQHCELQKYLADTLGGCELVDKHGSAGRYLLRNPELKTGALFGTLEDNKARLALEDFQVSQTTLENIFNKFARNAKHRTNE
mmetsp:Transcript_8335/g.20560  ORF Transcript_8335/g.20560 Transcript_8335/m.20560 type:complete len:2192 (-) Transcript_8335:64-6639(-)